jgi:hypothetical protein
MIVSLCDTKRHRKANLVFLERGKPHVLRLKNVRGPESFSPLKPRTSTLQVDYSSTAQDSAKIHFKTNSFSVVPKIMTAYEYTVVTLLYMLMFFSGLIEVKMIQIIAS